MSTPKQNATPAEMAELAKLNKELYGNKPTDESPFNETKPPKKQNYGKYGFDKPLVRYLKNQRKMSYTDGGVDYDYDPRTETFTGGMMGGQTVKKTLKEMMADATKPKLRPRDILNMPRENKPMMEGDVEAPFDPTITPPRPRVPDPRDGPGRPTYPESTDIRPPRPSPRPREVPFQVMPRTPDAQIAAPPPVTGGMGGMGMKKGGKVKASSYKSSGNVSKASSASKRGDGIAQRGKTKGRMV